MHSPYLMLLCITSTLAMSISASLDFMSVLPSSTSSSAMSSDPYNILSSPLTSISSSSSSPASSLSSVPSSTASSLFSSSSPSLSDSFSRLDSGTDLDDEQEAALFETYLARSRKNYSQQHFVNQLAKRSASASEQTVDDDEYDVGQPNHFIKVIKRRQLSNSLSHHHNVNVNVNLDVNVVANKNRRMIVKSPWMEPSSANNVYLNKRHQSSKLSSRSVGIALV